VFDSTQKRIVPAPQQVSLTDEEFELGAGSRILVADRPGTLRVGPAL